MNETKLLSAAARHCGKVTAVFRYFCGKFPAMLPIHMHAVMVNAGIENEAKKVVESVIWIDRETGKSDNFAENKITT